jgi:hypothetical protein
MMPTMDEKRASYSLSAPAASGSTSALRLPGRDSFPAVDDHLVEPEVTRDEIINGRRVISMPAQEPHATQNSRLDYVLQAHVAPGYQAATDLITRHAVHSDFASDACIYKQGTDPTTGARYLEEIAFEVVSTQSEQDVTEKAVEMSHRGVRQIFGIFVKDHQRVCEWSAESRSWHLLDAGSSIEDPCLVKPLPVAALLDAAVADNAVVEALAAKGNSVIREREKAAEHRGEARGVAQGIAVSILEVLEERGIAVSLAQREKILACSDVDRSKRRLRRAASATSANEVMTVS